MQRLRLTPLLLAILVTGTAGCDQHPLERALDLPSGPMESRSYREGTRIFLEVVAGSDTARVGLEEQWGAAIVEASFNGVNYVNAFDAGREVQTSLYDGNHRYDDCSGCKHIWGWNPVQAGDRERNGGEVLEARLDPAGVFARVRPNHWFPNNKGGGHGRPVPADVVIEQEISAVEGHPRVFRVRYTIRHDGDDSHAPAPHQELPAIYVNREFHRFIHYSGTKPWTNGRVTISELPNLYAAPRVRLHASEWWGALVDDEFNGLTVYTPAGYPYFTGLSLPGKPGPTGDGTNYVYPFTPFGLAPHETVTGDVYLIVGDYRVARRSIYELQRSLAAADIAVPIGDMSVSGSIVRLGDQLTISGWAYDNVGLSRVEVLLNDSVLGTARLTERRGDVREKWQGAPLTSGYSYKLKTAGLPIGPSRVTARARDDAGNVSEWSATVDFRQ